MGDNDLYIDEVANLPSYCYIAFSNGEGEEVGRLEFEGKEMKFTGKADEAADVFFNYWLKNLCDEYIASKELK